MVMAWMTMTERMTLVLGSGPEVENTPRRTWEYMHALVWVIPVVA
jgi:hypothetical protein